MLTGGVGVGFVEGAPPCVTVAAFVAGATTLPCVALPPLPVTEKLASCTGAAAPDAGEVVGSWLPEGTFPFVWLGVVVGVVDRAE